MPGAHGELVSAATTAPAAVPQLPTPLLGMVGQVSSAFFPLRLCYVSVFPFHSRSDVVFINVEKFMFTTSLYLESAL